MFRILQGSLIAGVAIAAFLYLTALPEGDQPNWYRKGVTEIRTYLMFSSGQLEDKLAEQLTSILRTHYGYDIGPHRRLQLLAPPKLLDWIGKKRPDGFYHVANTISQPYTSYSETLLDVYGAYGRFLDSIDLEKLAGPDEGNWPTYLRSLKIYQKLVADSSGIEKESAKNLRRDIQKVLSDAAARAKNEHRSKKDEALQLYAAAKLKYSDIAYKVNVEDSETAWLQPSFTMSPSIDSWVYSAPEFTPEPITGFTTIALTEEQSISAQHTGATPNPGEVPSTTTQGSASATLTYKHIGRIVITPGKWFDPFVVKYFAFNGPFRAGTKMWGPEGTFPSMPVGLIVVEDPSVALDVTGIGGAITSATITSVGPIQFPKSDLRIATDGSKTTLVHSNNRVYLLAVIVVDMPFIQ